MPVPGYAPSPAACIGTMPQSGLKWAVDIRSYLDGSGITVREAALYYVNPYGSWEYAIIFFQLYAVTPATWTPAGSNTSVSATFAQAIAQCGSEKALLESYIPEAMQRLPSIDSANAPIVQAEGAANQSQQLIAETIYDYQAIGMSMQPKNPLPYPGQI